LRSKKKVKERYMKKKKEKFGSGEFCESPLGGQALDRGGGGGGGRRRVERRWEGFFSGRRYRARLSGEKTETERKKPGFRSTTPKKGKRRFVGAWP